MDYDVQLNESPSKNNAKSDLENTSATKRSKCNALIRLALDVVKRDTEKAALLKLKGYDRVDIERNRGKHSIVCRHWLKGMCMKGEFCDFLHQLVYSRMPPCRSFEKNGFCIDLIRGNCIFQHTEPEIAGAKDGQGETMSDVSYVADPIAFATAFVMALSTVFPQGSKEAALNEDGILDDILESEPDNAENDGDDEKNQIVGVVIPGINDGSNSHLEINNSNTKCFIIKCNNMMNIYYSICYGIWATGPANTAKFRNAFINYDHVLLIFSGNESGGFQGYARMMTQPISGLYKGVWGKISNKLGDNFRVKWIKQCSVDFDKLRRLTNPLNNNCPLKKSRDGTELPLDVAEIVCNTLNDAPTDDLLKGTPLYEWEKIDHETYFDKLQSQDALHTPVGLKFTPLTN
ncbi:bifunctional Zinc finger [Babesia duncani]|uniref:Bifunctional Zinc finger n=1 Tax=Babesia duncani TaxID=323732 RepID=A0AAD9UP64_9APIC|nr:bifunctional Zinc finger [Babesia duncani]